MNSKGQPPKAHSREPRSCLPHHSGPSLWRAEGLSIKIHLTSLPEAELRVNRRCLVSTPASQFERRLLVMGRGRGQLTFRDQILPFVDGPVLGSTSSHLLRGIPDKYPIILATLAAHSGGGLSDQYSQSIRVVRVGRFSDHKDAVARILVPQGRLSLLRAIAVAPDMPRSRAEHPQIFSEDFSCI